MSTGQETTSQDHHNLRDDLHPSGKITGDPSYLVQATGTDASRLISDVYFDMTGIFGLAALCRGSLKAKASGTKLR
jgi:hypothetical protein